MHQLSNTTSRCYFKNSFTQVESTWALEKTRRELMALPGNWNRDLYVNNQGPLQPPIPFLTFKLDDPVFLISKVCNMLTNKMNVTYLSDESCRGLSPTQHLAIPKHMAHKYSMLPISIRPLPNYSLVAVKNSIIRCLLLVTIILKWIGQQVDPNGLEEVCCVPSTRLTVLWIPLPRIEGIVSFSVR